MNFTNDGSDESKLSESLPFDNPMSTELDELLGAYALNAVDPDEVQRVEEYLAVNPRAASEVRDHREIASMLAFSGAAAPDGVWERIQIELAGSEAPAPSGELAGLLNTPNSALTPASSDDASSQDPVTEPDASFGSNVVSLNRRRIGTGLLAAAAAVIVVAASVVLIDGSASAPDDPIASAFESAVGAPGSRIGDLVAAGSDVLATGVLGVDGRGYVDAEALPALEDNQTYQLWGVLASTGDAVSLGIMGARPGLSTFTVDSDVEVAALAITIEDSPGVVSDGNLDGAYVGALG